MISLDKFKVTLVEENEQHGVFEIGPLPKGYGYTLGNSIRRILLSSIPGAAVTAVQIDGVKHEYSTLEGVQDDVLSLVLKLKELALIVHSEDPQELKLSVKGKKGESLTIKASDFQVPSEVELINDELEVTTLTKDIDLNLTVTAERGVGYAYPDESKRKELGVIPIDSIFSPVKNVKLEVGRARFGQFTNLDQITLEINTDSTVKPSAALLNAVEIFDQMANKLVDLLGGDSELNELPTEEDDEEEDEEDKILVSQLNLSTRLTNALLNAGISDLRDLNKRTREEVGSFRGMGKKSMTELEDIMMDKEINFAPES